MLDPETPTLPQQSATAQPPLPTVPVPSQLRVAIVGGGITGAAAAYALRSNPGVEVHVFDQGGRGPGGRASHRRVCADNSRTVLPDDDARSACDESTFEFDHGCQFFRADSIQMKAVTRQWCEAGWAAPWRARFGRIYLGAPAGAPPTADFPPKPDEKLPRTDGHAAAPPDFFGIPGREPVYIGVGGMHQLPRALLSASGAAVSRATRVSSVTRDASGLWVLRGSTGAAALHDTSEAAARGVREELLGLFDVVILTDASSSLGGWHRASANVDVTGGGSSTEESAAASPSPTASASASVPAPAPAAAAFAALSAFDRVRCRVRVPLFTAIVALSHHIADPELAGLPYDAFTVAQAPFTAGGGPTAEDDSPGGGGGAGGGSDPSGIQDTGGGASEGDGLAYGGSDVTSPLWFAARSQSKPGFPRAAAEGWTLVSTPAYAVSQISTTPMQDLRTGAFRPQEDSYLLSEPGPALFRAFLDAVRPSLQQAGVKMPTAVYIHAQRWGSALPAPVAVHNRDERGFTPAVGPGGQPSCTVVCGVPYATTLPDVVYARPGEAAPTGVVAARASTEASSDAPSQTCTAAAATGAATGTGVGAAERTGAPLGGADFVDVGGGLFYAGDYCSLRNPGFEAAALSGIDAAVHIKTRYLRAEHAGAAEPGDGLEGTRPVIQCRGAAGGAELKSAATAATPPAAADAAAAPIAAAPIAAAPSNTAASPATAAPPTAAPPAAAPPPTAAALAAAHPAAAAVSVADASARLEASDAALRAAGVAEGMRLRPAGRRRFSSTPVRVFETRGGVRLAFQLSLGEAAPLLILGGGQTGREQACNSPGGAEHPAWAEHTVLILDRTNTGASDVAYRGGPEVDEQVADLAELLDHLNAIGAVCRPWIMIGHSSGGRMLGRLAFKRPGLVHAAALLILTGGHTAATELGEQYYHSYARAAAEADGTLAVLKTPLYAALCESNTRSLDRLRHMPAQAFIAAMRASADFLLATRDAPALGLPAAELRRLGENTPLFVCNYFGQGEHDGMHTAAASRAVAEAAGQRQCELVVSADPKVWLEGLVHFVRRNAGTSREV